MGGWCRGLGCKVKHVKIRLSSTQDKHDNRTRLKQHHRTVIKWSCLFVPFTSNNKSLSVPLCGYKLPRRVFLSRAAVTWSGRNFSSLIWGSLFTVSSLTLESNPAGCAVSLLVRLIEVTCHMMNFKLIKWKCSGFSLAALTAVAEVNVSDPRRRSGATDGCPVPHQDIQAGENVAERSMCYRGGTKVLDPLCAFVLIWCFLLF